MSLWSSSGAEKITLRADPDQPSGRRRRAALSPRLRCWSGGAACRAAGCAGRESPDRATRAGHQTVGREGNRDMIEARGLTKRYGDTLAVDGLSFSIEPGKITGF